MPGETWWPILDIPARAGALFKGEPIKGLRDWDTAVVSIKIKDTWTHVRFAHHRRRRVIRQERTITLYSYRRHGHSWPPTVV